MKEKAGSESVANPEAEEVLKQISSIARFAHLEQVRFVECSAVMRQNDGETPAGEARISCVPRKISHVSDRIEVNLHFAFVAPSPLENETSRIVEVRASLEIVYLLGPDWPAESRDSLLQFGRVNGIFNAWPYLREYLHSSLVRLGLPPFELPLLRVEQAMALADQGGR